MGFRQAAVLASVSFFLGVLFICYNVDHRVLFQPLSEETAAAGFQFYTTFYEAPLAVKGLLHGMMGVGLLALVAKLHAWDESAIFFDGTSLALFVTGVIIYSSVTIGMLRTIVHAVGGVDTVGERVDALRVLSAGNTLIALCLLGVLGMQGGQEYARRMHARGLVKEEAEGKEAQEGKEEAQEAQEAGEQGKAQEAQEAQEAQGAGEQDAGEQEAGSE